MNKIFTKESISESSAWSAKQHLQQIVQRVRPVWKRTGLVALAMLMGAMGGSASSFAQKVKLENKNVTYRKIFQEINRQTGYHYLWTAKNVDPQTKIEVAFHDLPLEELLQRMEENYPLTFEINNKVIKVKEKAMGMSQLKGTELQTVANATRKAGLQQRISGQVLDEKGNALVGVSVTIEGKRIGTVTDANGSFVLENVDQGSRLVISYVGYVSKTVEAKLNMGSISLEPKDGTLEEAVVRVNTGYQSLPRERMTGSFSHVSGEQLESKLATGLQNALEGQAAGVVIDKSGKIEIRGVSTFRAEKVPLLVVDGYPVQGNINDINPMNIASITVLKDGVAASIYGSRAANGVIVVTTKSGRSAKPRVNYAGFVNIIQKPNLKDLKRASTSDYIDAEIDNFNFDPNAADPMSSYNMSRVTYLLMQVRENKLSEADAMAEIDELRKIDGLQQIEDAFFRKEISYQHNLGISGGTEAYNYNVAINYMQTQQNLLDNSSKRMIFDLKNEWKPFSFLTAGASASFSLNNAKNSWMEIKPKYGPEILGSNYETLTAFGGESMLRPYTSLYDAQGNHVPLWGLSPYKISTYENTPGMKDWSYYPLRDIANSDFNSKTFTARITGFLRAQLLEGLTAEVGGNWERGSRHVQGILGADAYKMRLAYNDGTSVKNNANHYFPDGAMINENRDFNESWTIRTQVNYAKDFQGTKHRLNVLAGSEIRKLTFDRNQLASRLGYNPISGSFIPVNIKDFEATLYDEDMLFPSYYYPALTNGDFRYSDNRFVSWYSNASYEYDDRFIVSGSVRLDLTNFFGTDKKYRYKPLWSLGGTYKLSNEDFWNKEVVNKLFVRGSYGINGNISLNNGPSMILYAGQYSPVTGGVSYHVAAPPNNQLRWEKTKIANLGIDFGLFGNRVEGSLDYYNKKSEDLLAEDAIDETKGYGRIFKNVGAISNHGIELSMNVKVLDGQKLGWTIAPNVAYNFNKVTSLKVNRPYPESYLDPGGILEEGYPSQSIWGFRFAGLNDKGQTQVYNRNNDVLLIADAKPEDIVYQGTFRPKWDLALTNRFRYQDWSLSFMFIGKFGHSFRKDAFTGSNIQNRHVAERWRKPGDEAHTMYPVSQPWNMDMFLYPYIDRLVGNASYVKLRDVTLTYDISKYSKVLRIANAQIYAQGRNLFRITAKGIDIDPETAEVNTSGGTGPSTDQGFASLPRPREYFIGVRIGF